MRTVIKAVLAALVASTLGISGTVAASGGPDIRMESPALDRSDNASLQRGAKLFVNYCLNCHSARFVRYNRLTDIALAPEAIQEYLMFAPGAKIGDTMTIAMAPKDAKAWFGAPPPDLSVEARVRGTEWLYNYMLAFYQDDASATGWNNLVFPNVGMPHVLWKDGGINRLVRTEYKTSGEADAAVKAAKGIAVVVPTKDHKYVVETLAVDTAGRVGATEYKQMVADLVNYLDFMAEPNKLKARTIGTIMVLFFFVLFVFAYLMKKEYWKDVH